MLLKRGQFIYLRKLKINHKDFLTVAFCIYDRSLFLKKHFNFCADTLKYEDVVNKINTMSKMYNFEIIDNIIDWGSLLNFAVVGERIFS